MLKSLCFVVLLLLISGSIVAQGDAPTFSDPTAITNPYYPVASIARAVWHGDEDGTPVVNEVTLLPYTRSIDWNGDSIEVLILQDFVLEDGLLVDVGYEYYAQADDGSVYQLGEDATAYEDGQVVDHDGTWLVGEDDAPPMLIMPGEPDTGVTFELDTRTSTVVETGEIISLVEETGTPISDGILIRETDVDGTVEEKVWAAGFGLVEVRADDEFLRLEQVIFTGDDDRLIALDVLRLIDLEATVATAISEDALVDTADALAQAGAVWARLRPLLVDHPKAEAISAGLTAQTTALRYSDHEALFIAAYDTLQLLGQIELSGE